MTKQSKNKRLPRSARNDKKAIKQLVDMDEVHNKSDKPLLYYRTMEEIRAYRKKPVKFKMQWLEAQMEFFHKAMPQRAKRIRKKIEKGQLF
ncbi:MAG: hypothetical protein A3J81_01555 [Nitrospirae bacterium RIFOXYB2_FULL_43_5]|nr:MAG: hypothetical protein A2X54_06930 [Nitrospirae bacterium GWF2_44_13]OGW63272.1 MAG: hypothetical protein A2222_07380 [Nitrospirae bacterium RIFOXYA2_FULL_44_9]OGW73460.1 MAG: hypothetical protein A3J81_01555 [Nitrospirae bacterium RIFOXYB2_FULL_43_5]OGW73611.1 MAG: hypothetical protein A2484_09560 [Nitrospirae bacterium RIFOXYC2_FULL_44_7]